MWLMVLGAVFEDGVPLPSKVAGRLAFRQIFGGWLLVSVILTNCYNGLMITGLNSPLDSNLWESWRDWVCHWKTTNYSYNSYPKSGGELNFTQLLSYNARIASVFKYGRDERVNPFYSENCPALLSFPEVDHSRRLLNRGLPSFVNFLLTRFVTMLSFTERNANLRFDQLWINLYHPNAQHFPGDFLVPVHYTRISEMVARVEGQVVACGQTAFVAEVSETQSEFEYLSRNYYWNKFYMSRDILEAMPTGVSFEKPGTSRVPGYYRSLTESGIVGRLMREHWARRNYRRQSVGNYTAPEFSDKMTMNGCIHTLFILCAALAGLGGVVFVVEWGKVPFNFCKFRAMHKFARVSNAVTPYYNYLK